MAGTQTAQDGTARNKNPALVFNAPNGQIHLEVGENVYDNLTAYQAMCMQGCIFALQTLKNLNDMPASAANAQPIGSLDQLADSAIGPQVPASMVNSPAAPISVYNPSRPDPFGLQLFPQMPQPTREKILSDAYYEGALLGVRGDLKRAVEQTEIFADELEKMDAHYKGAIQTVFNDLSKTERDLSEMERQRNNAIELLNGYNMEEAIAGLQDKLTKALDTISQLEQDKFHYVNLSNKGGGGFTIPMGEVGSKEPFYVMLELQNEKLREELQKYEQAEKELKEASNPASGKLEAIVDGTTAALDEINSLLEHSRDAQYHPEQTNHDAESQQDAKLDKPRSGDYLPLDAAELSQAVELDMQNEPKDSHAGIPTGITRPPYKRPLPPILDLLDFEKGTYAASQGPADLGAKAKQPLVGQKVSLEIEADSFEFTLPPSLPGLSEPGLSEVETEGMPAVEQEPSYAEPQADAEPYAEKSIFNIPLSEAYARAVSYLGKRFGNKTETKAPAKSVAERLVDLDTNSQQHPPFTPTAGFSIEEHPDRYRIYGVQHNNSMHAVDITRNLLENGASHTQEEWATLTQNKDWQKANGIWQLGSAPLQTAAITSLYNNQNIADAVQKDLVEKVRDMLKEDFKTYWMMTSTRVCYKARGKDIVAHDYKYPQQTEIKENIAGPNGFINANCGFDNALNALCGISPAIAEQAYEYISGRKPYLWRINSKSAQDIERALMLDADSNRFDIDAGDGVSDDGPARGWSAF